MKIAEYKKVKTEYKTKIVHHEEERNDSGELIKEAYDEKVQVGVPVMGVVYREETEQEKAERERQQIEYENSIEYKQQQIEYLKQELATYDYIGVKLAMGVATRQEYAKEISYTEELRMKIRALSK